MYRRIGSDSAKSVQHGVHISRYRVSRGIVRAARRQAEVADAAVRIGWRSAVYDSRLRHISSRAAYAQHRGRKSVLGAVVDEYELRHNQLCVDMAVVLPRQTGVYLDVGYTRVVDMRADAFGSRRRKRARNQNSAHYRFLPRIYGADNDSGILRSHCVESFSRGQNKAFPAAVYLHCRRKCATGVGIFAVVGQHTQRGDRRRVG